MKKCDRCGGPNAWFPMIGPVLLNLISVRLCGTCWDEFRFIEHPALSNSIRYTDNHNLYMKLYYDKQHVLANKLIEDWINGS